MRFFTDWFGPLAYHHLSVVASVGVPNDSLPELVYVTPDVTGGYASAVTNALVDAGKAALQAAQAGQALAQPGSVGLLPSVRSKLDEAFSLQVSRQWWGNMVSPASFHDTWLSTGFAGFSASLFSMVVPWNQGGFRRHWLKAREELLQLPSQHPPLGVVCSYCSQVRPNETGSLWMGVLNDTFKTPGASNIVSASKGGYILNMLRSMMWDSQQGDADFRAMMQDFVKQYANQTVSTEDFKSLVEKHMKPPKDMDGNHRMDWFFNDWVYGTDVPSYRVEYSLSGEKGGKPLLTGRLTQTGVSTGFRMIVPLFAAFAGGKTVRIAFVAMRGDSTRDFRVILPEEPKRILLNLNYDVLTDKEEVKLVKQ